MAAHPRLGRGVHMNACPSLELASDVDGDGARIAMAADAEMALDSSGLPVVSKSRAMEIETGYAVKLFFSASTFVQVYFEAVANAFDAGANEVSIRIQTDPTEITIKDDGQGFTDERFDRFARLVEPVDRYHKGLGRLVCLNYFSVVHVVSFFEDKKRTFTFSDKFNGSSKIVDVAGRGTSLRLTGFHRRKIHSLDDLKPAVLREKLLEQFLPLLRDKTKKGRDFTINIELETRSPKAHRDLFSNSESITPVDVPALECKTFQDNSVDAFANISMSYMLRPALGERMQLIAACIDGRTIPIKLCKRQRHTV
jgi:hypothetical protein